MPKGRIITIGSFDGVHRGHQALLECTVLQAKKRGLKSMALTFSTPPRMILDPKAHLRILSDSKEKERLLLRYGMDDVRTLTFDQNIAVLKPFYFFRHTLLNDLRAKGVVVGADFRFGAGRCAGALELVRWGEEFEIPVWVISPVRHSGKVVSSSMIRELFEMGRFRKATGFLGHPYVIGGVVVPGRGIGKKLGAATANLAVSSGKILPRGVYAVRGAFVKGKKKTFTGVCNIGVRPTLEKNAASPLVEVHIFGEHRDLIGQALEIELLHFLRPEKKFSGVQHLKLAIAEDVRRAQAFLARKG